MSVAQSPNIIFILADDVGYGDVGCYNQDSKIPTPSMDSCPQKEYALQTHIFFLLLAPQQNMVF